jgi:hypothetical protein
VTFTTDFEWERPVPFSPPPWVRTDFDLWDTAWARSHSEAALRKLEREEAKVLQRSPFGAGQRIGRNDEAENE